MERKINNSIEEQKIRNSKIHSIFKFIFILSLLYYVFWLIISIGISSESVGVHIYND